MAIVQAETEVTETVTDADFGYPEHEPSWLSVGVCSVCGRIGQPVNDLGGQDPAPRFGADEYLNW